jgi:hypothetical protein
MTGGSLFFPKLFSFLSNRKSFTLYEGWVAGYIYYDGPDIEESLRAGQPLELRREPENEHDGNAIEIYAGSYKLGYISRVDNSILARLMDQGAAIEAEVAEVALGAPQWKRVKVRIQTLQGFRPLGGL